MEFAAAPIYEVWPMGDSGLKPYQAAVKASASCRELIRDFDPDAVVADILTVATSLAAQTEGRPWATLIPHVLPTAEPGFPPYSIGARLPRTRVGARVWRLFDPLVDEGARAGPRAAERRARAGRACRRSTTCTAESRASLRSSGRSRSSSTRGALAPVGAT